MYLSITSLDWKSIFQAIARPLHWGRGLPPLCAFSLWFYDRSARLNSFFTYVTYITLPIQWIQTTYNKSVHKYFSDDNEKAKGMRSTQYVRDCTIWYEAQLVAASPRKSPLCLNRTWSNSAILIIKMIGIIQKFNLKQRSVDTYSYLFYYYLFFTFHELCVWPVFYCRALHYNWTNLPLSYFSLVSEWENFRRRMPLLWLN